MSVNSNYVVILAVDILRIRRRYIVRDLCLLPHSHQFFDRFKNFCYERQTPFRE